MKELEDENWRLKKIYAEGRLKPEVAAKALTKSGSAISAARDCSVAVAQRSTTKTCMSGVWHKPDVLPVQGQAES